MHLSFAASENISRRLQSWTEPMEQDGGENEQGRSCPRDGGSGANTCSSRDATTETTYKRWHLLHDEANASAKCTNGILSWGDWFDKRLARSDDMNAAKSVQVLRRRQTSEQKLSICRLFSWKCWFSQKEQTVITSVFSSESRLLVKSALLVQSHIHLKLQMAGSAVRLTERFRSIV